MSAEEKMEQKNQFNTIFMNSERGEGGREGGEGRGTFLLHDCAPFFIF